MQSVIIKKPCQRAHERGQEEIIAVCLNKECQNRLCCINCQREHPKSHLMDLCHFDFLAAVFEKEMNEYTCVGIHNLINQTKQEFKDAKACLLKLLDLLEADFVKNIERVREADQLVCESIKMVEVKDFQQFKEIHAQALVVLKDSSFANRLKKLIVQPIIQEIKSITLGLQNQLQSTQIIRKLKEYIQNPLWIDAFQNNRPQQTPVDMKLIIEENIQQLNEGNIYYFGGFQNSLKHGKGILINKDLQEIQEGIWENNKMKWGLKIGRMNTNTDYVYVGTLKNYLKEGMGNFQLSNGEKYEGQFYNDKMEGQGIHQNFNEDHYKGEFKNNLKNGMGFEKYLNGDSYEGNFRNNKRDGKGIYKFQGGDIYEGEYKNGKMEGQGIYKSSNGYIEVGQYNNNLSVGEHKVYKQASDKILKTNIYDQNGDLLQVKILQ